MNICIKKFEFDAGHMGNILHTIFCSNKELYNKNLLIQNFDITSYPDNNNLIPYIPAKHISSFFHAVIHNNSWSIYHVNDKWEKKNIEKKVIDAIIHNEYMHTLVSISDASNIIEIYGIVIDNNQQKIAYNIQYCVYSIDNPVPVFIAHPESLYKLNLYTDDANIGCIIDTIGFSTDGKLICINSTSFIDLLFLGIKVTREKNDISELINRLYHATYRNNLIFTLKDFESSIKNVKKIETKSQYNYVSHLLLNSDDTEYFNNKFNKCQDEIEKITTTQPDPEFIANFIYDFKKDLCVELALMYNRFLNFPNERIKVYEKFPKHPYINVLKHLHATYTKNKICIDAKSIYELLCQNKTTLYEDFTNSIIELCSSRSDLFLFVYDCFEKTVLHNIKPKYKNGYKYFPMRVFSPTLYIVEHMLSNY